MPANLPPLPDDLQRSAGAQGDASAFAGGQSPALAAIQQIEAGVKGLVQAYPSLAPVLAQFISQLRQIVPSAMSPEAGNGMAPPPQGAAMGAPPSQPLQ